MLTIGWAKENPPSLNSMPMGPIFIDPSARMSGGWTVFLEFRPHLAKEHFWNSLYWNFNPGEYIDTSVYEDVISLIVIFSLTIYNIIQYILYKTLYMDTKLSCNVLDIDYCKPIDLCNDWNPSIFYTCSIDRILFTLLFVQYSCVDLRTVSYEVPPQEMLSRDSVTVSVDAVCFYKVGGLYRTGFSFNFVFFSKNCLYFATSPSPALGCYLLYKNCQPIRVTVHSDLLRGWVLLHVGEGLQRIGKKCNF